ncbi:uncharacterized protein [Amphiura filiformis]|uniref:uncharacterized protein n=1 Tax=Amphiura filiformis TaxID=82378 RepID=UPI003B213573
MWMPVEMVILDPGSPVLDIPCEVSQVFEGILTTKNSRAQQETIKQLTIIHDRVKAALAHFGMNTNIHATASEVAEENMRKHRPPGFQTKLKREEMLHKQNILDTIHEFLQISIRRETLMDEVGDWLYDVQTTLEKNVLSEEDMKDKIKEEVEMERNAYQAMNDGKRSIKKTSDKFRALGREMFDVMKSMAKEDEEGEFDEMIGGEVAPSPGDVIAKRMLNLEAKVQRKEEPLNDSALMAELANWKSAAVEVKKALDDAFRMARTNIDRNGIKAAMKQFAFMLAAVDRRNQENMQLSQEILEVEVKVNHLQKSNEKTEMQLDKKTKKLEALEAHVQKLNAKMAALNKSLKEAHEQVKKASSKQNAAALEAAVKAGSAATKALEEEKAKLLEELKVANAQHAEKEAELLMQIEQVKEIADDSQDTSEKLNRVVENLQMQLADAMDKIDEYENRLEISSTQNKAKQSRQESMRDQYVERIKDYKKEVDAYDIEVGRLKEDIKAKEETIHIQENKISDLQAQVKQQSSAIQQMQNIPAPTGSPAEFRQMVTRIKGDYEQEIHRLKEYQSKEKQRGEAGLRRQEQEMKSTLNSVYKETTHLLRALNRFKENMAALIEKEGLLDTGHEIKQIQNLVVEEKPTDSRLILSQLAGNAVELLVSLELKIAQAFMNKRLEMKEALQTPRQRTLTPVVEIDTDMDKVTKENEQLTEKLQKAQDQIVAAENILSETKRINEESYKSLLERHKALILRSTGLQRELKQLEQAFREEIKKRDNRMRSMKGSMAEQNKQQQNLISQLQTDLTSGQRAPQTAPNYEKMRIKVSEQLQNLNMLEDALKENKISLELHTITVDIINQAIEVPEMRLKHLFERYIIFRKLKEQKDSLIEKLDETGSKPGKDKKMEGFFMRMETRMQDSIKNWQARKEELKKARTKLYEQMGDIFDVVTQEAGIIMHKPKDRTVQIIKVPSKRRRVSIGPQGVRVNVPTKPESVIGQSMHLIGEHGPFWHMPPANWEGVSLVTCPRMLQFDVDARRIAAKQALQRLGVGDASYRQRSPTRSSQTPSVPPLATMFPPISK